MDAVHRSHFTDFSNAINDAAMFDALQETRRKLELVHLDSERKLPIIKDSPLFYILLSVILFLVLFSTGAGIFILRFNHHNYNQLANDVIEMKSLYQATTCMNCTPQTSSTVANQNQSSSRNEDNKVDIAANKSVNVTFHCSKPLPDIPSA